MISRREMLKLSFAMARRTRSAIDFSTPLLDPSLSILQVVIVPFSGLGEIPDPSFPGVLLGEPFDLVCRDDVTVGIGLGAFVATLCDGCRSGLFEARVHWLLWTECSECQGTMKTYMLLRAGDRIGALMVGMAVLTSVTNVESRT